MKIVDVERSPDQEVFEVELRSGAWLLLLLGVATIGAMVFVFALAVTGRSPVEASILLGMLVASTVVAWLIMRSVSWQEVEVTVRAGRVSVVSLGSRHQRPIDIDLAPGTTFAVGTRDRTQKVQLESGTATTRFTEHQVVTSMHQTVIRRIERSDHAQEICDRIERAIRRVSPS